MENGLQLEKSYRNINGKRYGPYYCLSFCGSQGRTRFYLKGMDLQNYKAYFDSYKRHLKKIRRFKKLKKNKGPGRPPSHPVLKNMLAEAGLTLRGSTLKPKRNYCNIEAVRIRFYLLDSETQDLLGSPENMQAVAIRTISLLKSANRRREEGANFDSCMHQALREFLMPEV